MREPLRSGCALRLAEVAEAVGARRPPGADPALGGVATDSRDVQPGDLFVALPGEQHDGHAYVAAAVAAGAGALLLARAPSQDPGVPALLVPDTTAALGALARWWRQRLGLPLVAVTGSNGKTTTKEMLAAILAAHAGGPERVLVTPGNFNNHVGVPLTLLRGTPEQRLGVVELGMNAPGEIDALTAICEPQVGLITNAAEAHLARFGGQVEGVARAKAELWARMAPEAVAVVNLDDPRLPALAASRPGPRKTFGQAAAADVRVASVEAAGPGGLRVALALGGERLEIALPLLGRHNAWNAAAATAAALALGVPAEAIREGLARTRLPEHRSALLTLGGVTVLDDCYNANPASVRAAVDTLLGLPGAGRAGAILGDLRELGETGEALHRALGRELAAAGVQVVVALGPLCAALCEGAREAGVPEVIHVADASAAAAEALARFRPGDRVLVKGSRAMGLEAVIHAWREAAGHEGGA